MIAKRANEPFSVAFAASAAELLDPVASRFRPLALRSDANATPLSIDIRRAGVVEQLKRTADGAGFAIAAPVTAPADGVAAPELARLLGSLEAVRFVADSPAANHGLAPASSRSRRTVAAPAAAGKPPRRGASCSAWERSPRADASQRSKATARCSWRAAASATSPRSPS